MSAYVVTSIVRLKFYKLGYIRK